MGIDNPYPADRMSIADAEATEQLRAAYAGLKRHVPLLYAVVLANVMGIHVAMGGEATSLSSPAPPLVLLILWRLRHWLRAKKVQFSAQQIETELRKTFVYAVIIAGTFSAWAQYLLAADPASTTSVVFFSTLATIGCAYSLSSHVPAATVPLGLLGAPIALRLMVSGDSVHFGMGLSFLLVMALTWRLLRAQNRAVLDLVSSGIRLEQENCRAQAAESDSRRLASIDSLTEIANRRALLNEMQRAKELRSPSALALIDLDGFKPINDAFGHHSGDLVLKKVAQRLKDRFGAEATVARMGGDEFALFWRDKVPADLEAIGGEICGLIEKPIAVYHRSVQVFACCGFVRCGASDWPTADFLRQADLALYAAKRQGKGRTRLFSQSILEQEHRRSQIEKELASGASDSEMRVVFQPIADLATGQVVAFEALARWSSPRLGRVNPDEFILAAERMNLIGRLTEGMLERALACASGWPDDLVLSFNVSSIQLCELGAADRLLSKIEESGFDPKRFQVELTETALLADFSIARENISILRNAGASIALDDFGSGHASISYLREMCFDVVKLDGSMIADVTRSAQMLNLLRGVIDLCRSLGVRCVAEHVETADQLASLRALGCDAVQGYYLGRPTESFQLNEYFDARETRKIA